jgi:hypothetical protein
MHRNAPLTPEGRLRLCRLIEDGWTIASSAESMRISRQTAHKWWGRRHAAEIGPFQAHATSVFPGIVGMKH